VQRSFFKPDLRCNSHYTLTASHVTLNTVVNQHLGTPGSSQHQDCNLLQWDVSAPQDNSSQASHHQVVPNSNAICIVPLELHLENPAGMSFEADQGLSSILQPPDSQMENPVGLTSVSDGAAQGVSSILQESDGAPDLLQDATPAPQELSTSNPQCQGMNSTPPNASKDPKSSVVLPYPPESLSLMEMDPSTQDKGKELQEMMRLFKETTTQPLSAFVLHTPVHKTGGPQKDTASKAMSQQKPRESPRLKAKLNKDKSITKLAQDLVAKKCGVIQEEQSLDSMTLNQYLQLYKQPLSDDAMQAIVKLTDVAVQKKEKKTKAKKDKKDKAKNLLPGKLSKSLLPKKKAKKNGQAPLGAAG
jgi:hypothetical protein